LLPFHAGYNRGNPSFFQLVGRITIRRTMTPIGFCEPSIAAGFSGTIRPALAFTATVMVKPSPAAKAVAPAVMVKPIWLANAVPVAPSPTRLLS
jgi:hypothetical protein